MATASAKQVEDYLQKIRRLPSNKICANCRATSRLGFGAVCVKYQSFVCDMCKSSHQSFSHRTKSVTMSTWTLDEVKALDEKNGGGNDWCRARWFAKLSESDAAKYMPKEGDSLDDYKSFVNMAYEQSKWYDANGRPSTASSAAPSSSETTSAKPIETKQRPAPGTKKATPSPAPSKPQKEEDLLILDFDSVVSVSSTTPTNQAAAIPVAQAGTSPAQDEWGSFTHSTPQLAGPRPAASMSDDWTFQAAPPVGSQVAAPAAAAKPNLMANLQSLYQPQAPAMMNAFPVGGPSGIPLMPGFASPQPMAPMKPVMGMPPAMAPTSADPFSHLHAYQSAPSVMVNRTSSSSNGNAAPSLIGTGNVMMRSQSAPSNDPFAGLI